MPNDPTIPTLAEAMHQLLVNIEPFTEASTGYRAQMIAAGYSEEHAEMIAAELHVALIRMATKAFTG